MVSLHIPKTSGKIELLKRKFSLKKNEFKRQILRSIARQFWYKICPNFEQSRRLSERYVVRAKTMQMVYISPVLGYCAYEIQNI